MSHIMIEREGESLHLPEAKVADVIALIEHLFDREKRELLADLEDAGAGDDVRFEAVRKLRAEKGLTSTLIRSCFSLAGAVDIVRFLVKPELHDKVLDAEADEGVWLALRLLGFDVAEEERGEEEKGNPTKDRATSTRKL